jgi:predicted Zn-dependent protease with MMP-like domain
MSPYWWRTYRQDKHPGSEEVPCCWGIFDGVPATEKSVWNLSRGPDHIVLYQKNIEAVCSSDDEVCEQVRRTVLHELGHYFGMTEAQLRDL